MQLDTDFEAVARSARVLNWRHYGRIKSDIDFTGVGDATPVIITLRQHKLRFQSQPLHTALLLSPSRALTSAYDKKAVELNKLVLILCGDKSAGTTGILARLRALHAMCGATIDVEAAKDHLTGEHMAEELYVQIMKQLTDNSRFESECLGWRLLCYSVACVKLTNINALQHVLAFLYEHEKAAQSAVASRISTNYVLLWPYIQYCIRALGTLQRGNLPSEPIPRSRLAAFLVFDPVLVDVQWPDSRVLLGSVPIKHSYTSTDFVMVVARLARLATTTELGLFQRPTARTSSRHDSTSPPAECSLPPNALLLSQLRGTPQLSDAARRVLEADESGAAADLNIVHLLNSVKRLKLGSSDDPVLTAHMPQVVLKRCCFMHTDIPRCSGLETAGAAPAMLPLPEALSGALHFPPLTWNLQFLGEHLETVEDVRDATLTSPSHALSFLHNKDLELVHCQTLADLQAHHLQFEAGGYTAEVPEWWAAKSLPPVSPLVCALACCVVSNSHTHLAPGRFPSSEPQAPPAISDSDLATINDITQDEELRAATASCLSDAGVYSTLMAIANDPAECSLVRLAALSPLASSPLFCAQHVRVHVAAEIKWPIPTDPDYDHKLGDTVDAINDAVSRCKSIGARGGGATGDGGTPGASEMRDGMVRVGDRWHKLPPSSSRFVAEGVRKPLKEEQRAAVISVSPSGIRLREAGAAVAFEQPHFTRALADAPFSRVRWYVESEAAFVLDYFVGDADNIAVPSISYVITPLAAAGADSNATTQIVDLMDDIKARWCASAPQRTLHPATRAGGLHCLVGTGTGTEPAMVAARLVADFRNCDAKLATPLARGASPDATGMVSPARMFARSLRTLTSPKPR